MPRIEAFRALCSVVEQRSFTRAAQVLGITQPAISQQIRRLEDEYETQLIHRQGGVVVSTPAGSVVYEYAAQIVALVEKSLRAVGESVSEVAGQLAIAASTGVGEGFLPQVLVSFRNRFPEVRVNMQVGDSAEILNRLLRERLDLGFVGSTQHDRHLKFDHFVEDQLILVVSPHNSIADRKRISQQEFLELPLILQQAGSGATSALHQSLSQHGIQLKDLAIIGEAGLQESTKSMVRSGSVGTIISRLGALRDLEERRLVEIPIDGLSLRHDFFIAHSKDWPLSQAAQAFIDTAREGLAGLLRNKL